MEFDLKLPAIFVAVALPFLSALILSPSKREYVYRLGQVAIAYVIIFSLICAGYIFESAVSNESRVQYFTVPFLAHFQAILRIQSTAPDIYIAIIVSCVVSCALLFAENFRTRTTNTLRAAFFCFMAFDIFIGMETGFSVAQYIYNMIFNLIGAFILSVFAPMFLEWIPYRVKRSD